MPCQCQEVVIKFACDHEQNLGLQTQCDLAETSSAECPDPTIQIIPDASLCTDCADAAADETEAQLLESSRAEHEAFLRSTGGALTDEDEQEMLLKAMRESSLGMRDREAEDTRKAIEASMRQLNQGEIGDYLTPEMFERGRSGRVGRRPDGSINPAASGSGSSGAAAPPPPPPAPAPEPVEEEAEAEEDEEADEKEEAAEEEKDGDPDPPAEDVSKPFVERMVLYGKCKHWVVSESQVTRTKDGFQVHRTKVDDYCPQCKGSGY